MAKKEEMSLDISNIQRSTIYQHTRGEIKDNAIKALLHDRLFHQRIEKKLKGKGSYQRKAKHAHRDIEKPDHKISTLRHFMIGFFLSKLVSTTKH